MEFCSTNADPLKAAEAIVSEASERWATRDQDNRRDDITVVVVKTNLIEPLPPIDGAPTNPAEAEPSAEKQE